MAGMTSLTIYNSKKSYQLLLMLNFKVKDNKNIKIEIHENDVISEVIQ